MSVSETIIRGTEKRMNGTQIEKQIYTNTQAPCCNDNIKTIANTRIHTGKNGHMCVHKRQQRAVGAATAPLTRSLARSVTFRTISVNDQFAVRSSTERSHILRFFRRSSFSVRMELPYIIIQRTHRDIHTQSQLSWKKRLNLFAE